MHKCKCSSTSSTCFLKLRVLFFSSSMATQLKIILISLHVFGHPITNANEFVVSNLLIQSTDQLSPPTYIILPHWNYDPVDTVVIGNCSFSTPVNSKNYGRNWSSTPLLPGGDRYFNIPTLWRSSQKPPVESTLRSTHRFRPYTSITVANSPLGCSVLDLTP